MRTEALKHYHQLTFIEMTVVDAAFKPLMQSLYAYYLDAETQPHTDALADALAVAVIGNRTAAPTTPMEVESTMLMNEHASLIEETILADRARPAAESNCAMAEKLLSNFPWLGTDEEEEISGADTIDELQRLYDSLDTNS